MFKIINNTYEVYVYNVYTLRFIFRLRDFLVFPKSDSKICFFVPIFDDFFFKLNNAEETPATVYQ